MSQTVITQETEAQVAEYNENKVARGPLCAAQYVQTCLDISPILGLADKDETKFEIILITLSDSKINTFDINSIVKLW